MKSMKKVGWFILMAVIGANLAIVQAKAEGDSRVAINVPFDFVAGNSVLKAGNYKVEVLQSGVLDFWSIGAQQHHFTLIVAGAASASQKGDPYFVFTRYGSETFLSKVALSADDNFEVPTSSREKELISGLKAGERGTLVTQPAH
jgi:hypothetical protein